MTDYNATVEVAIRLKPDVPADSDFMDRVIDNLAGRSPAISVSERGWMEITITVTCAGLMEASMVALTLVKEAAGAEPISIDATTTAEYDKRNGLDIPMPDLISVTEAAQILDVSRQAVLDRIGRHTLPATKVGREWVIRRASLGAPKASA